ncbi:MarP family serine protease [Salinibacterium sp. ZJ454]|uniref:MarP family serine protease n=1 Tax=Salinibacterium sp. ZJ454 TaxID=2708339 RepID=UPI001422FE3D|nr:MarP family serine protease [Salinibacterium sp. ZJ454]
MGIVLDILLILLLIGYLVYGFRAGFFRSLGGILGVAAGGVAAFFAIPVVSTWVPAPEWRTPAIIATLLLLIALGNTLGATLGNAIGRQFDRGPLRIIERLFGAAVSVAVAALVISAVSVSVGALGIPLLTPAIASSAVLRSIESVTPAPVKVVASQLRSLVLEEGIPRLSQAIGGTPAEPPTVPDVASDSPGLARAAQSVVRVTGAAYSCGQNQTGTGFVIAPDRVITNAHVVSGVTEPIMEAPNGEVHSGEIVYFDPVDDLAVLAFDDLDTAPLEFAPTLAPGSDAVFNGYPFGGPFSSKPAGVISVGPAAVADIYGQNLTPREVYTLAADVQQGNSGGPLLSADGAVVGVIFAKSATTTDVGFALTMEEVAPVIAQAPGLDDPVASGSCTSG